MSKKEVEPLEVVVGKNRINRFANGEVTISNPSLRTDSLEGQTVMTLGGIGDQVWVSIRSGRGRVDIDRNALHVAIGLVPKKTSE